MNRIDLKPECFGQLGKARRAGGGGLDGQVAEHVATAGMVVVMVSRRLLGIVGIHMG